MKKGLIGLASVLLVSLVYGSFCEGGAISYGNLTSNDPNLVSFLGITEDSASDPNTALFGAPRRIRNRLAFTPTGFASYSPANSGDTTSGTLSMEVLAPEGKYIESIVIKEDGDCSLSGSDASATINGYVSILDLDDEFSDFLEFPLIVTPNGFAAPDAGAIYQRPTHSFVTFNGAINIDLTGLNLRYISFNFNNTLQTTAGDSSTAFIQKKHTTENISVGFIVPEPASILSLLALSVLSFRKKL